MDDGTIAKSSLGFPVVGIGASAGGLEALKELVQTMPRDSGVAYVIVQHFAPDHPSIMDQLLQPTCPLPVAQIKADTRIEPDHVYLIPPGRQLALSGEGFEITPFSQSRQPRKPIDHFFASIADACGQQGFGVILSGTGTDGTVGIRAIKSAGGVAGAQDPDTAKFASMPESIISTGLTDFILPPADIPVRIDEVLRHRAALSRTHQEDDLYRLIEARLPEIIEILEQNDYNSFRNYKPGTLVRRIERRMILQRIESVDAYIEHLRGDRAEQGYLVEDFMIGVTQFFRDPDALAILETRILPELVADDTPKLRLWVPACSTGEECYSLAILLAEEIERQGNYKSFQIFGTDINDAALNHARRGQYSRSRLRGLSDERLARHFKLDGDTVLVSNTLRENCIFALHSVIEDPPYSQIDVVSFKNALIYFNNEAQAAALSRVHYALKPSGVLALGPSETTISTNELFVPIDRTHRVFRRNNDVSSHYGSIHGIRKSGFALSPLSARTRPPSAVAPMQIAEVNETHYEQAFLARLASPFLVVNEANEVVYVSEGMSRLIQPSKGSPSSALNRLLTVDLRLPVLEALSETRKTGAPTVKRDVVVRTDVSLGIYDIHIDNALADPDKLMVVMREVRVSNMLDAEDVNQSDVPVETSLLRRSLDQAQRQIVQLETSIHVIEQQYRTSNEELLSMNEELQSSNEELDTSREELQSMNEELETVNAELRENNEIISESRGRLKNLLESVDVGVIFLDKELTVSFFTPAIADLFAIREVDLGRPFDEITPRFDTRDLHDLIEAFQKTGKTNNCEVSLPGPAPRFFNMRLRARQGADGDMTGIVLIFVDITEVKLVNAELEAQKEELQRVAAEIETVYREAPVGLALLDEDLRYVRVNDTLAAINGIEASDHLGKRPTDILPDTLGITEKLMREVMDTGEDLLGYEITGEDPTQPDRTLTWLVSYFNVCSDGRRIGLGVVVLDVTENRRNLEAARISEAVAQENEARLERLFDSAPAMIAMYEGPEHRFTYSNQMHDSATGNRELIGRTMLEAFPELAGTDVPARFDTVLKTGKPSESIEFEAVLKTPDGTDYHGQYRQILQPVFGPDGSTTGVMTYAYDVTEQVRGRALAAKERRRLLRILDSIPVFEAILGATGRVESFNHIAGALVDTDQDGPVGQPFWDASWWVGDSDTAVAIRNACERASRGETVRLDSIMHGSGDESLIFDLIFAPIAHCDPGSRTEVVVSGLDVTARQGAEARAKLLLRELQHRVKNTLAVVLAITEISADMSNSKDELVQALSNRLRAISRNHDRLTQSDWSGERLSLILKDELEAYHDGSRVQLTGKDPRLNAKQALALALGFHELITNALKYGALSNPSGSIHVECADAETEGQLQVTWVERDGPPVKQPEHIGFGTFLLREILAGDLDGTVDFDLAPEGLRVTMIFQRPSVLDKRHPE